MKIKKRDGSVVEFNKDKIAAAITKAFEAVTGSADPVTVNYLTDRVVEKVPSRGATVEGVQDLVVRAIQEASFYDVATAYTEYRYKRALARRANTTDASILSLLRNENKELAEENSNKSTRIASTQRDYIAGEVSRDLTRRILLPEHISKAHDDGVLHFHDMDYFVQPIFNCFSGNTKFITRDGVAVFNSFEDGAEVEVLAMDGQWHKAVVHKYGKQVMYDVTLTAGRTVKTVTCTKDHRWVLADGSVTTALQEGNQLYQLPVVEDVPTFMEGQKLDRMWEVTHIELHSADAADAWCVEEPDTHSFTLEDGVVTGNCCLINIGDMLDNGTVMNDKLIESPKSFQVACTVMTQIIACIASNQYGGQSVDLRHLGKYLRKSKDKFTRRIAENCPELSEEERQKVVAMQLKDELKSGVQTIQYQINTLMTTNGQSPFVTLFLYLRDDDPYIEENALIIEEVLRQRLEGIKNEAGVYITPAFPKLVYVLDENNCLRGGKYDYLTKLAVRCSAKRMYPDYISAKKMKENYEGNVFSPMGCVDGHEVITYKFHGTQYTESFERMWSRLADYYEVKVQPNGKDLYMDTDGVMIYDHKAGFVKNYRVIRNLSTNWLRLKFSNGRTLLCTNDHPFETENRGVVHAEDLKPDDRISVDFGHAGNHNDKGIHFNPDRAWLLGMLLCDSSYIESIVISIDATGEDEIEEAVRRIFMKEYGLEVITTERQRGKKGHYKDLQVRLDRSPECFLMKNRFVSLFGGYAKINRQIPNEVFTWDYESRLAFMAGMIDADGYINSTATITRVQIGSTNKELALQQMYLAQSLGFRAYMYLNHYSAHVQNAIRYRVEFIPSQELIDRMVCLKKKNRMGNIERTNDSISTKDFTTLSEMYVVPREAYSYDVTTETEHFTVSGIWSHNCRSFLAPWKDENGEYKFEGRYNQGVVSLNLPQIGILAQGDEEKFWSLMDERLQLCYEALMCRHEALRKVTSDCSPLHWQYGALARLGKGESIEPLLYGGYSSISLGYIGLYEVTKLMKGVSHTDPAGTEFAMRVMKRLRKACDDWKAETNIGFALYGTPAESLCYRFARIDKERFGDIPDITDKGYYTNSYHVDVREKIDAFTKLKFENQFQPISSGGCISYAEIPNMMHNLTALEAIIRFIYDNVQYAEFNTKSDFCQVCGFEGEILINDDNEWECPICKNRDQQKMNVVRRTCGYLGEKFWNVGKTKEIKARVLHL